MLEHGNIAVMVAICALEHPTMRTKLVITQLYEQTQFLAALNGNAHDPSRVMAVSFLHDGRYLAIKAKLLDDGRRDGFEGRGC